MIARVTPQDWQVLRSIRLEALRTDPQAFLSTWERESQFTESHWREMADQVIFLATTPAGPAGMLGIYSEETGVGVIWGVFVGPQGRRRGLARQLMDAALEWARQQGLAEVRLEVNPTLSAAVGLYRAMGLEPTGTTRNCCGGVPAQGFRLVL